MRDRDVLVLITKLDYLKVPSTGTGTAVRFKKSNAVHLRSTAPTTAKHFLFILYFS